MVKRGILYFHQGWTDIINCLGLINYYCHQYDTIYLVMRKDAKQIIDFYTKDLKNIEMLYEDKEYLDVINIQHFLYKHEHLQLERPDLLGIGQHDYYRDDEYKYMFATHLTDRFFVEKFYICYNIPYSTRIDDFTFTRDHALENRVYQNFIHTYGHDYILYHNVVIDQDKVLKTYGEPKTMIHLNKISDTLFDMILVLENALEIHLLDSVWGTFMYQLDAKYKLFKDKKITLYAKRGYKQMFTQPIQLDHWIIVE